MEIHEETVDDSAGLTDSVHVELTRGDVRPTWLEQWRRVLRWHQRVRAIAEGELVDDTKWLEDLVFGFFVNAFNLRDWISHDAATSSLRTAAWKAVDTVEPLKWCADLANGTKHLRLTASRVSPMSKDTRFEQAQVIIYVPPANSDEAGHVRHRFVATATDDQGQLQTRDAYELADEVVFAWGAFLDAHGLWH